MNCFRILSLPLEKHVNCELHDRCFFLSFSFTRSFLNQLLHLCLVGLIELYIIFSNEFVPFRSATLRSLTIAKQSPRGHALANVYATIVDDLYFVNCVA